MLKQGWSSIFFSRSIHSGSYFGCCILEVVHGLSKAILPGLQELVTRVQERRLRRQLYTIHKGIGYTHTVRMCVILIKIMCSRDNGHEKSEKGKLPAHYVVNIRRMQGLYWGRSFTLQSETFAEASNLVHHQGYKGRQYTARLTCSEVEKERQHLVADRLPETSR